MAAEEGQLLILDALQGRFGLRDAIVDGLRQRRVLQYRILAHRAFQIVDVVAQLRAEADHRQPFPDQLLAVPRQLGQLRISQHQRQQQRRRRDQAANRQQAAHGSRQGQARADLPHPAQTVQQRPCAIAAARLAAIDRLEWQTLHGRLFDRSSPRWFNDGARPSGPPYMITGKIYTVVRPNPASLQPPTAAADANA